MNKLFDAIMDANRLGFTISFVAGGSCRSGLDDKSDTGVVITRLGVIHTLHCPHSTPDLENYIADKIAAYFEQLYAIPDSPYATA
jgi:hypothetical protein